MADASRIRIFLSHQKRDDAPLVREFKKYLPDFLSPWFDEKEIKLGDSLSARIKEAISVDSDFLFIFLRAKSSTWVKKEMGWALQREASLGRNFILPVLLDNAEGPPKELGGSDRFYLRLPDSSEHAVRHLALVATECLFRLIAEGWKSRSLQLKSLVQVLGQNAQQKQGMWTRSAWKLPLGRRIEDRVLSVFDHAIHAAKLFLESLGRPIEMTEVRANLFLPETSDISYGDLCTLTIPQREGKKNERLQRGMEENSELQISFRPRDGATGRVYAEERAIGVLVVPEWERLKLARSKRWVDVPLNPAYPVSTSEFTLIPKQEAAIDKGLTWLISMPVLRMVADQLQTLGVFNIDCKGFHLKEDELRRLFAVVAPYAGALSGVLREAPAERLAILKFPE